MTDTRTGDTEKEIRTVEDLNPDRDVYYASHTGGPQRSAHLHEDCRFLDHAKNQFSSVARTLDPDRDVCRECAGSVENRTPEGTDVQATRKQLSALDPSALGLSALGERSVDTETNHDEEVAGDA